MTHGRDRWHHELPELVGEAAMGHVPHALHAAMGEIACSSARARGRSGHVPACSICWVPQSLKV